MNKVAFNVSDLTPEMKEIYLDLNAKIDSAEYTLPRLPEIVHTIDKALNDDTKTSNDIAEIIKMDPAVAGRVIQVANSPLVRGSQRITSLKIAIMRIGLNFVRNLVFCMTMRDNYAGKDSRLHSVLAKKWIHSVRVMMYSYFLAKRFPHLEPDIAMIAGIIHDIGSLPLYEYTLDQGFGVEKTQEVIMNLHVLVGIDILVKWDMEDLYIDAIKSHHAIYDENVDGRVGYEHVVTIADIYSEIKKGESIGNIGDLPIAKTMNVTTESLDNYFAEAEEEIEEIQKAVFG